MGVVAHCSSMHIYTFSNLLVPLSYCIRAPLHCSNLLVPLPDCIHTPVHELFQTVEQSRHIPVLD